MAGNNNTKFTKGLNEHYLESLNQTSSHFTKLWKTAPPRINCEIPWKKLSDLSKISKHNVYNRKIPKLFERRSHCIVFEKLRQNAIHKQLLDYEELDSFIYLWRRFQYYLRWIVDENCLDVFIFLQLTARLIRLIPRSKFNWKHPLKNDKSYNRNQNTRLSIKQVLRKWLKYNDPEKEQDDNDRYPPFVDTKALSKDYYEIYKQLVKRFKYELNRKLNRKYKEYIGCTDTYFCEHKQYSRKKCPQCWKSFNFHALHSPIRYCACALACNDCCTACIIPCGPNENVPICPDCAINKYLIPDIPIVEIHNLLHVKLVQSLSTSDKILIKFEPLETKETLYFKGVLIEERFASFNRDKFRNEIGPDQYHRLLKEFIDRKRNVTHIECIIDLEKAKKKYYNGVSFEFSLFL